MKPATHWLLAALLVGGHSLGIAQEANSDNTNAYPRYTTDEQTGMNARAWLREQAEGVNRGEVEAYRAESAGKAYRSYSESIGAKNQPAPTSQVSSIRTN